MPLMSTSSPSVKFTAVGDSIAGVITGDIEERAQTDYVSGAVKTWPDGAPMTQWVVPLYCADEVEPGDDGRRTLFVKAGITTAVRSAVRQSGARDLEPGGTLTVTYTADAAPKNPGMHGAKVYSASYVPPAAPTTVSTASTRYPDGEPPF